MEPQIDPTMKNVDGERLTTLDRFLETTIPDGYAAYYNQRRALISKEHCIANIERGDMVANGGMVKTILEMLNNGQISIAHDYMILYLNDSRSSMGFDGVFMKEMLVNKIEYEQTQHVHEHTEPSPKRGILGSGRG